MARKIIVARRAAAEPRQLERSVHIVRAALDMGLVQPGDLTPLSMPADEPDPTDRYTTFPLDLERFVKAREAAGYIQSSLARAAGVRPSTINGIERGRKNASLALVRDLAQLLGVELDDIKAPS